MAKRIVAQATWIAHDFVPETFGRLTTVSSIYKPAGCKEALQDFVCICGNKLTRPRSYVKHGNTTSCGCARQEAVVKRNKDTAKHGYFGTPTYRSWSAMVTRCEDPTHMAYHNYGGRGIKVHPDMRDFIGFLLHMGERPSLDHSLDRINNEGDYAPDNCRWATRKEQAVNTRFNRFIEHDGKRQTLSQWAKESCVPSACFHSRLNAGWNFADALYTPSGVDRPSLNRSDIANSHPRCKKYNYDGKSMTVTQWAVHTGIHRETIRTRLIVYGWSIEEAVTTPVRTRKLSQQTQPPHQK